MSISHGPNYLGDDATIYLANLTKNPPPRYSLDYIAKDGDDCRFRPQIEIHATIGYDLDGTAVHVRSATVEKVVMYARPDFSVGATVRFEYVDSNGRTIDLRPTYAAFVKTQASADEAWQSRAFDAAQDAETARRCGDDF